MMTHATMASGRWHEFSFPMQMANIGSEVHRARNWKERSDTEPDHAKREEYSRRFKQSVERALELIDLTRQKPPTADSMKELGRVRDALATLYLGETWYDVTLEYLDAYFDFFLNIAVRERERAQTTQSHA